eukprot:3182834-Pyramimonas_sp.AAC.1
MSMCARLPTPPRYRWHQTTPPSILKDTLRRRYRLRRQWRADRTTCESAPTKRNASCLCAYALA